MAEASLLDLRADRAEDIFIFLSISLPLPPLLQVTSDTHQRERERGAGGAAYTAQHTKKSSI